MGFFDKLGIKKVEDRDAPTQAASKQAAPRQQKKQRSAKQKGPGLLGKALGAAGVKAEPVADEALSDERDRHETIILAWLYLRAMIDKGVKEFYAHGVSETLNQHVERPTLDALKDHLTQLRAQGIYWEQPKRRATTTPQIKVIAEQLDSEGVPVHFTVQERFHDFSFSQKVVFEADGSANVIDERRASGKEVALNASVQVLGDDLFRLLSVERADHVIL